MRTLRRADSVSTAAAGPLGASAEVVLEERRRGTMLCFGEMMGSASRDRMQLTGEASLFEIGEYGSCSRGRRVRTYAKEEKPKLRTG
jgi:hypothetical protein